MTPHKTFYHGTSSVNLDSIKAIGIVPGHAKGGDAWAAEHHWSLAKESAQRGPSVFLTDSIRDAENFARLAVTEVGGNPIVITLHVPEHEFAKFVVDELYHAHATKPHAWRVSSIPPRHVAEVLPVKPGPSEFDAQEQLRSLITAILGLHHSHQPA